MEITEKSNKLVWIAAIVLMVGVGALAAAFSPSKPQSAASTARTENQDEKVYVALEGEGRVAVVDPASKKLLSNIDLSEETPQGIVRYMAHNVQVLPNGDAVLVTANVEEGMDMGDPEMPGMDMPHTKLPDQLIVIDPKTDTITRRIPIDVDSHLAHVVATADGRIAYVTLQEKGFVYAVDLERGAITAKINLGEKSGPHGLRLTADGKQLIIALLSGTAIAFVDTTTNTVRVAKLSGAVVQTAVTPDGTYAFASVYDTKEIAWFSLTDGTQGGIPLPEGSRGPVQLYPTPDSRYLYVADQGYYFDQPQGNKVYRMDVVRKSVDQTIAVGAAPHGVAVNKAGTLAFITNLLSDDLSIIDTSSNTEIARIPVGDMPNGVSVWNKDTGGTP